MLACGDRGRKRVGVLRRSETVPAPPDHRDRTLELAGALDQPAVVAGDQRSPGGDQLLELTPPAVEVHEMIDNAAEAPPVVYKALFEEAPHARPDRLARERVG